MLKREENIHKAPGEEIGASGIIVSDSAGMSEFLLYGDDPLSV